MVQCQLLECDGVLAIATLAFAQLEGIERGLFDGETQTRRIGGTGPVELRFHAEPAVDSRRERLRKVGSKGRQRQAGNCQVELCIEGSDRTGDGKLPQRRGGLRPLRAQRPAQCHGHRLADGPVKLLGTQCDAVGLQGHGGGHGGVVPEHAGAGQFECAETDLPARRRRGLECGCRVRHPTTGLACWARLGGSGGHARACGVAVQASDPRQIYVASSVASSVQLQAIDAQRREAKLASQWLDIAQHELHLLPCQQGPVFGVGQHELFGADLPRHGHRRHASLGDAELQSKIGRNTAPGHAYRQGRRQVTKIGHEVQVGHLHFHRAALGLRERGGLRTAVEGCAVELECQARLDLDLDLGWQVRQERQRDLQGLNDVDPPHGPIVESKLCVAHLQVVEREANWIGGRGLRTRREPGDQVVDGVVAITGSGDAQGRRVDLERLHHRGALEKRRDRQVYVDARDSQ